MSNRLSVLSAPARASVATPTRAEAVPEGHGFGDALREVVSPTAAQDARPRCAGDPTVERTGRGPRARAGAAPAEEAGPGGEPVAVTAPAAPPVSLAIPTALPSAALPPAGSGAEPTAPGAANPPAVPSDPSGQGPQELKSPAPTPLTGAAAVSPEVATALTVAPMPQGAGRPVPAVVGAPPPGGRRTGNGAASAATDRPTPQDQSVDTPMVTSVTDMPPMPPGVSLATEVAVEAVTSDAGPSGRATAATGPERREMLAPPPLPPDLAAAPPSAVSAPTVATPAVSGQSTVPASVADQILPSVIAMAQGGKGGHGVADRLTISITPDALGHVSITVNRAADGTTVIQVSAERLATLEMLRTDQAELVRALDQAGLARHSHSLSFSWEGGNGGMPGWSNNGWGNPGEPQGERRPGAAARSYADEPADGSVSNTVPNNARATAIAGGGIDLTA